MDPIDSIPAHESESSVVRTDERDFVEDWFRALQPGRENTQEWIDMGLPFEFSYGTSPFREQVGNEFSVTVDDGGEHGLLIDEAAAGEDSYSKVTFSDGESGLVVEWEAGIVPGFPAIEWIVRLRNEGETETELIEDFRSLDLSLTHDEAGEPYTVYGANGGRSKNDDYHPFRVDVPVTYRRREFDSRDQYRIELGGDNPSSNRHLPFFNLETPEDRGLVFGIGWSGQWKTEFEVDHENERDMHVRTGLERTSFTLRPGESVRSPRSLVLYWEGERLHGHNTFRRMLDEQYVPDLPGDGDRPLVTALSLFAVQNSDKDFFVPWADDSSGDYIKHSDITSEEVNPLVKPYADLGLDMFILDSAWHRGAEEEWVAGRGDWRIDTDKWPGGFQPLADRLHGNGMDFGVWYAPESVNRNSPLHEEHPGWVKKGQNDWLPDFTRNLASDGLRLDLPQAREWFLDHLDTVVDQGLDCFRQDNVPIYGTDPSYREGMAEITHMDGIYGLWDEMLDRYPDLVMEGCAGGGRRIDLETLSRFHWNQQSDLWYNIESNQTGLYGANLFLPGGYLSIFTRATDAYGAYSSFPGQLYLGWHPTREDFPMDRAKEIVETYKKVKHLFHGDFYPLTPPDLDQAWLGYQFHRRDLEAGVALVFRRPWADEAPYPTTDRFQAEFRGLKPDAEFGVRLHEASSRLERTGAELADGLELEIESTPGVELLTYERSSSD